MQVAEFILFRLVLANSKNFNELDLDELKKIFSGNNHNGEDAEQSTDEDEEVLVDLW